MSKFLKTLFENKGCIDDPDEVERVTDDMAYCRLCELSSEMAKFGQNILKYVFLPTDEGYNLRYGELANLVRILCCDQSSSDPAAHLKLTFIDKAKSSLKATLFKSVTLRAFADFVDKKTGTARGSSVYNRVSRIASKELDFTVRKDTTFNALFNAVGNRMQYWNISCTVDVFAKKTSASCLITKLLLIDCFRFVYSDLFVLSDLKDRLTKDTGDWQEKEKYEYWYGTADNSVSKYDRTDHFGDDYDTEAMETPAPRFREYVSNSFFMTEDERRDWDKLRFGILNSKKAV